MKKVSIIIPCFNHATFLENSISSALSQDYPDLEIIIANDGSTDNSLEVANKLALNNSRVIVLDHENKGVVATRNEAIRLSTGDYILPLDADDFLASNDVISEMVKGIEESEAVLVFGNHHCFGQDSNLVKPQLRDLSDLLVKNFVSATSMFTREVFDKVGGYSEKMMGGYEDWEFAIRVATAGKLHKIEKTIFFYRTQSISRNTEADKIRADLFDVIIKNNPDIYYLNLPSVIAVLQKEIELLRKKLKSQKRLKKILVIIAVSEFSIILILSTLLFK